MRKKRRGGYYDQKKFAFHEFEKYNYINRNGFSLFIGLNAKTSNYMLVDSLGPAKVVMSEEDIKEDDDEDMNEEDDSEEEEEEEELMEDDTEEVKLL